MNKLFPLLLLVFALATSCSQHQPEKDRPNFLFIFADDMTYEGIRSHGNPEVITPNLDKLSEAGVSFTHSYNMGGWNGAICVASRAMLNTGRFLWKAQAAQNNYQPMKDQGQFWSLLLANAGYETYMTGKWHVSIPADSLFMHVRDIRPGMPKSVPEAYNRPLSPADTTWLPWHTQYGGYWEGGKHWSEVVGDNAIDFLDQAQESEKPFFMYLAFNAPHDPRQSPKRYVDMYPVENIKVPENYLELYPYKDSIGCGPGLRDEKLAPFPRTEYSIQTHRQEYYAIITHLDDQLGRIVSHLKQTGQDKNTYILFSADHGLAVGHHGLVGKQNMFDPSMRVPLIVVGPNIPENEKRDMQVYLQDIMATTLDLAGVEKPAYIDFNSLMPLVNNEKQSPYNEIYGAYINLQRMVRTDRYKLIVYPRVPKILLFDLEKDPLETVDLSEQPEFQEIKTQLISRLKEQQKQMDDPLDLHTFFPDLF